MFSLCKQHDLSLSQNLNLNLFVKTHFYKNKDDNIHKSEALT